MSGLSRTLISVLVFTFTLTNGLAQQQSPAMLPLKQTAYIKASNAEAYDYFADGGGNQGHNGNSIAMSADGNTMAVGAPYESGGSKGLNGDQNDNSAYASGAVYIFFRQGASWTQQAYIKASNTDQSDHFGASVALSHDGNTLAVAAPWESSATTGVDGNQSDNSTASGGRGVPVRARRQRRGRSRPTSRPRTRDEPARAKCPATATSSVTRWRLSGDGNTLAVGAISEDSAAQQVNGDQKDDTQQSSGRCLRVRAGQEPHGRSRHISRALTCRPATCSDLPLRSASTAARSSPVRSTNGARAEQSMARATTPPAAPERSTCSHVSGSAWTQEAYIKGSRTEATDQLGYVVAISDDGNTIAAGAGDEDCLTPGVNPPGCDNDSPPRGAANIWVGAGVRVRAIGRDMDRTGVHQSQQPRPYNSFGVKLALSGDGNTLAVSVVPGRQCRAVGARARTLSHFSSSTISTHGAKHRNQAEESGAVYVYTRAGCDVDAARVCERIEHGRGRRVRQRGGAQRRRQNHGHRRPQRGQRRKGHQRQPDRQLRR